MNDPVDIAIAFAIIASTGGGVVMLGLVVRALVRRWTQGAAPASGELDQLRSGMLRLEAEVSELHERLDFAERVLARDRPAGLPDG